MNGIQIIRYSNFYDFSFPFFMFFLFNLLSVLYYFPNAIANKRTNLSNQLVRVAFQGLIYTSTLFLLNQTKHFSKQQKPLFIRASWQCENLLGRYVRVPRIVVRRTLVWITDSFPVAVVGWTIVVAVVVVSWMIPTMDILFVWYAAITNDPFQFSYLVS